MCASCPNTHVPPLAASTPCSLFSFCAVVCFLCQSSQSVTCRLDLFVFLIPHTLLTTLTVALLTRLTVALLTQRIATLLNPLTGRLFAVLDLITKMIEINPKERQTAEQLLGHRYFKQIPVEARVLPQGVRDRSKLDLKTRLEDLKLKRDQLESSSRSSTSSVPLIEISLESLEQELEATDRNFAKVIE